MGVVTEPYANYVIGTTSFTTHITSICKTRLDVLGHTLCLFTYPLVNFGITMPTHSLYMCPWFSLMHMPAVTAALVLDQRSHPHLLSASGTLRGLLPCSVQCGVALHSVSLLCTLCVCMRALVLTLLTPCKDTMATIECPAMKYQA